MNIVRLLVLVLRRVPDRWNPFARMLTDALAPLADAISRLRPDEHDALLRFLATSDDEPSPLFRIVREAVEVGPAGVDKEPLYRLATSSYGVLTLATLVVILTAVPLFLIHDLERVIAGAGAFQNPHVGAMLISGAVSMLGLVAISLGARWLFMRTRELSSPVALRLLILSVGAIDLLRLSTQPEGAHAGAESAAGSCQRLSDRQRRQLIGYVERARFVLTHQLPFHVAGPSREARRLAFVHGWRAAESLSDVSKAIALPAEGTWNFVEDEIRAVFLATADRNWGLLRLSPRFPETSAIRLTPRGLATTVLLAALPPAVAFGVASVWKYPLQDKAEVLSVMWALFTFWRALDPHLRETLDAVRDGAKLIGYGSGKKD